jgi:probable dihydroxyacetone kinase regulator
MARSTKQALADSFLRLLSKHSFDKITVKDIVEDCGVNRQTFYYHFHDIYDLVEWIFQDAAAKVSESDLDYDDWTSGLEKLMHYLQDNRMLILNAYNSISHEAVADYIKMGLRPYCAAIVEHQAAEMDEPAEQEDVDFVTDLFTLAATGLVTQWIGQQMRPGDHALQSMWKFRAAMTGSIQFMLGNLREERKKH